MLPEGSSPGVFAAGLSAAAKRAAGRRIRKVGPHNHGTLCEDTSFA